MKKLNIGKIDRNKTTPRVKPEPKRDVPFGNACSEIPMGATQSRDRHTRPTPTDTEIRRMQAIGRGLRAEAHPPEPSRPRRTNEDPQWPRPETNEDPRGLLTSSEQPEEACRVCTYGTAGSEGLGCNCTRTDASMSDGITTGRICRAFQHQNNRAPELPPSRFPGNPGYEPPITTGEYRRRIEGVDHSQMYPNTIRVSSLLGVPIVPWYKRLWNRIKRNATLTEENE
jgi:hypothetical protein